MGPWWKSRPHSCKRPKAISIEKLLFIIICLVPLGAWPLARRFGIRDVKWKAPTLFSAAILAISILFIVPHLFFMQSTHSSDSVKEFETIHRFHGYMSIVIIYFALGLIHVSIAVFLTTASARLAVLQFWMFHIGATLQNTYLFFHTKYADDPSRYIYDMHHLFPIIRLCPYFWLLSIGLLIALPIWAFISKSRQAKLS